ncbi:MAG: OmpA family protein [Candidatus Tectomicrobia bacterium]|nr:OmpA family protein [Candidatus Tectomicrobia bacterium]
MTDAPPENVSHETHRQRHTQTGNVLSELRRLLIEPEQQQLSELNAQIADRHIDPEEMSRALPEAISRRPKPDKLLTAALMPTVEEAIKVSVKRDPATLVEVIFPVIGPAIRRSISQTLRSMIQSFNQALEHSVSAQGLQWRWEAYRTGRPFAEVVLLHTLLYRVEQVFLLHRKNGLLLHHVLATTATAYEPEAVAGMVTAIQDFVRDAFQVGTEETLETFQVGDLTVWIEQGPHALLAAVIRGNPPYDIRPVFQDALAESHLQHSDALEVFDGDPAPFADCEEVLNTCLISQTAEETATDSPSDEEETTHSPSDAGKLKGSPWFRGICALVIVGLGVGFGSRWIEHQRWNRYVRELRGVPGLVVTRAETHWRSYSIAGLRDPLAADPMRLLNTSKLPTGKVDSRWEPYQALHPAFILARARRALRPPDTVTLRFQDGRLTALGAAPRDWMVRARQIAPVIAGVTEWQDSNLTERP